MVTFKITKIQSLDSITSYVKHFQQLELWADFKSLHGWDSLKFSVIATHTKEKSTRLEFSVSVLVRNFKKLFSIAYIPLGPDFKHSLQTDSYLQLCRGFGEHLKDYLPSNTLFVRMDPPMHFETPEERDNFAANIHTLQSANDVKNRLQKSNTDIQPPNTTELDIRQSEDDVLKNMKSKWRYNIRLASRKGVVVKQYGSEHIDYFYDLFKETAERDRIATHSKSYYKSLLELSENKTANDINKKDVQVRLYVAHAPLENGDAGEALAAIIVLFAKGGQAVYLYGASSNKKRNLMPAYLLQWTAIQDAKQFDCISYDFYGIPPTNNKDHPMHGLWRFKTGFGGKNIHRLGSIDLPLSRWYYIYIKLEKIRTWYYKVFKKIS